MNQSTNHLFMIEPSVFYANPETMETNAYQVEGTTESKDVILTKARLEFRNYRDLLVEQGVMVTTLLGKPECPDMVFPNWASTYDNNKLILYPMLNENRAAERSDRIISWLSQYYPDVTDWSHYEAEGRALESTASIVADHVNKRAYSGLSKRTDPELAQDWADLMGYDLIMFETQSHAGIPVYHTDFLMYIGSNMAGICAECITDKNLRKKVLARLRETHEVIELTMEQLQANCGNALEVVGKGGVKMLTMSKAALEALTSEQKQVIGKHYETLICPDLTTLEKYGGGSARCMLMELF
ncbi:MAG: arginine deiminase-related protein [Alphaproteobacteria bacterium]|nr:arginine deiminase-related protein [Alphaproteobacteria bacterium]